MNQPNPKEHSSSHSTLNEVISLLNKGKNFILVTHREPDADGIGSMLALGKALSLAGKEVSLFCEEPLYPPLTFLKGSEKISNDIEPTTFSAVIALDCSDKDRIAGLAHIRDKISSKATIINIDHHITNNNFGTINLVEEESSSTGEIVFKIIERAGLPITKDIAENIFAAIQTDTGSFSYDNTTLSTFQTAARLMEYGVSPWELYRNLVKGYTVSRLKLLKLTLDTLEFFYEGKIGILYISSDMIQETGAIPTDSERFVDYPRFVKGVEIAALIRQVSEEEYKFSLRSNGYADVAKLASRFGGGGHSKAAGFTCKGDLDSIKERFVHETIQVLNGT